MTSTNILSKDEQNIGIFIILIAFVWFFGGFILYGYERGVCLGNANNLCEKEGYYQAVGFTCLKEQPKKVWCQGYPDGPANKIIITNQTKTE